MVNKYTQKEIYKIFCQSLLIFSLLLPTYTLASISELRLQTLVNICEAAQSNGDLGTVTSIAQQLKAASIGAESDLGKQAIKCVEAGFSLDKKPTSYENLSGQINNLQTELRKLCFDLLELKPTKAITFDPCKEFY